MRLFILALILTPSLSHGSVLGCGAKFADGRELMFQIFPGNHVQEDVRVSFGHLHQMKTATVRTTRTSKGFGLWKKDRFEAPGFKLENKGGGEYSLSAKLPAIALNITDLRIDCLEY
ncbi:MAG TPA: hypothetical protein VM432_12120 [Bdellovibrionales bacterium]|nr:hypothetical protein [Bdellovibrionales bacterium]